MSAVNESGGEGADLTAASNELLQLFLKQEFEYAVVLLDAQGLVVGWHAAAESIFGYTADQMRGKSAAILFTPEDIELGMHEHELRVARERGKAEDDRWLMRQDGTRLWVSGAVSTLRDSQGRIVGFSKIMRDRSELKSHIETLENRLKAMEDAHRRKNVFIATLGHELGNTLAGLRLTIGSALSGPGASEREAKLLARCKLQLETTSGLFNSLKDLARLEEGQVHLTKSRIVLNGVLEQVSEVCRTWVEGRRQSYVLLLPPATVLLEGDAGRLQEIFVNLVHNASKYTQEGGKIWVKLTTEGREAVVRVEDNGVGIGPETLPELFQLFTQEDSSRNLSQGGMGLGLWLVKQLVMLHGGTVSAKSEGKNRGSEFAVRLPMEMAVPQGASGSSSTE